MEREEIALKTFIGLQRVVDMLQKEVKRDVTQYGVTVTEFAVLELLYHKGAQPVHLIKDRILIANSSTTYVIDRLIQKGLVVRKTSDEDQRVKHVSLTTVGESMIKEKFSSHARMITEQFACLSEVELLQLHILLKKMSQKS